MEKYFMLAAPVLALSLLAGCCSDGNCYSSAGIGASSAQAQVAVESPAAVAVAAPEPEAATVAVTSPRPAPSSEMSREAATTKIMARIPAAPLPEGWSYIDESELAGGQVNAETVAAGQAPSGRSDS